MSLEWWWQQTLCGKFFLWNWRSFYVTLWGYSAVQASWTIWLRSSFLPSTLCSIWQVMSLPKPLLWMDLVQACCGFSATCCSFSWCWQAAGMSIDSSNAEWRKMLRSSSPKSWCHGREARTCQWFRRVFSRVYQCLPDFWNRPFQATTSFGQSRRWSATDFLSRISLQPTGTSETFPYNFHATPNGAGKRRRNLKLPRANFVCGKDVAVTSKGKMVGFCLSVVSSLGRITQRNMNPACHRLKRPTFKSC